MPAARPEIFILAQGHMLGPVKFSELEAGVRAGDYQPSDRFLTQGQSTWRTLGDCEEFQELWEKPIPDLPSSVPSLVAWKKARAKAEPPPVTKKPPLPVPPLTLAPAAGTEQSATEKTAQSSAPPAQAAAEPALAPISPPTDGAAAASATGAAAPSPGGPTRNHRKKKRLAPPRKKPAPKKAKPKAATAWAADSAIDHRPDFRRDKSDLPGQPETARERIQIRVTRPEIAPFSYDAKFEKPKNRTDRIRTRTTKWKIALAAVALAAGVGYFAFEAGKKTRDLKEFPLPDPSSPTTLLPATSDPISPLKAPTRPQRD